MSEETAFSLDNEERFAWMVIMGEHAGGQFDWENQRWVKRDA